MRELNGDEEINNTLMIWRLVVRLYGTKQVFSGCSCSIAPHVFFLTFSLARGWTLQRELMIMFTKYVVSTDCSNGSLSFLLLS